MGFNKYIVSWIQRYNIIENSFAVLKKKTPKFPLLHLFHPLLWTPNNHWSVYNLSVLSFPKCYLIDILKYVVFYWLLSTSNALKIYSCLLWLIAHSFSLLNSIPFYGFITVFFYPFTYCWTSWLFPGIDDYK